MIMYGEFSFFLSLGLGYALCVLAGRQKGVLKTLGYTIGIGILVLTFMSGLIISTVGSHGYGYGMKHWKGKMLCNPMKMGPGMKGLCPMMK